MRPMEEVLIPILLVGCLVAAVAVAGEQEGTVAWCIGPYAKRQPTPEELATVLRNHEEWVKDGRRKVNDPRRANLCQASLDGANLQQTNLQKAYLREAHLQKADLDLAGLQGAHLQRANLQGADLREAHLQGADLRGAHLQKADLQEARLSWAHLQGAELQGAHLQGARLDGADLQEARLEEALLHEAVLFEVNLQGANLSWAHLWGAVYEPHPEKLPNFWTLTSPYNKLETLRFHHSPAALIALREAFKKWGMRTQERQLTYAIEHTKRLQAWNPLWYDSNREDERLWLEQLAGKSESLFNYVWFELPSGYGMAPRRALAALALLIAVVLRSVHGGDHHTGTCRYLDGLATRPGTQGGRRRQPRPRHQYVFVLALKDVGGKPLAARFSTRAERPAHWAVLQPIVSFFPRLARAQRRDLDCPRAVPRIHVARHRLGPNGVGYSIAPQCLFAGIVGLDLLRPAVRVTLLSRRECSSLQLHSQDKVRLSAHGCNGGRGGVCAGDATGTSGDNSSQRASRRGSAGDAAPFASRADHIS